MKINKLAITCSLLLIILSSTVLCGWIFHFPLLVQLFPGFVGMVVNTASCFLLTGILFLLFLGSFPTQRFWQILLAACILLLALLSLSQDIFHYELGVDHWLVAPWLDDPNPTPGRMAPNTSIAFILSTTVCLLLPYGKNRIVGMIVQFLTLGILLIAITALLVYSLKLEFIFSWYRYTRMAVTTASAFAISSFGWWAIWSKTQWYQDFYQGEEDKKIILITGAILLCLTMIAGLGGVAGVTYFNLASLNHSLQNALKQKSTIFVTEIKNKERQVLGFVANVSSLEQLENLQKENFSTIQLTDAAGKVVYSQGNFIDHAVMVPIQDDHATLIWKNNFWLRIKSPVFNQENHQFLGSILVEAPLTAVNTMYDASLSLGANSETLICWRQMDKANCFPTRFNAGILSLPLNQGHATSPINEALNGHYGAVNALSYSQKNVIAAYAPLADLNLAIVVQIATEEIYKPIQDQLQIILPTALVLIVLGLVLLYWQVVPLVQKVLNSERQLEKSNIELAASLALLNQRSQEITLLREFVSEMQTCLSESEAFEIINHYGQRLLSDFSAILFLRHNAHDYLDAVLSWGAPKLQISQMRMADCLALRHGSVQAFDGSHGHLLCSHAKTLQPNLPMFVCVPILAQGEIIGLLYLEWLQAPNTNMQLLAVTFVDQLGLALANIRLRETLRSQNIHDPLTDLYNRRFLDEVLEMELSKAKRKNSSLAVLMLDVDHFKLFNDNFGHEAGDEILQALGRKFKEYIRAYDIPCRFGGEEFLIILPDTTSEVALQRAEILRQAVQKMQLTYRNRPLGNITISIGVAVYPVHASFHKELLAAADAALYQAKATGRNKVVIYAEGAL